MFSMHFYQTIVLFSCSPMIAVPQIPTVLTVQLLLQSIDLSRGFKLMGFIWSSSEGVIGQFSVCSLINVYKV